MPKTSQKERQEEIDEIKPGRRLREAREAMRLTQQEVAAQMKLNLRVITSIDNDQFEHLPPSGYVRGYLRSYALLVKLDPHAVIEIYNRMEVDAPALQPYSSQPATQAHSGDLLVRVVTWSIVLLLIGLLVMWWQSHQEDTESALSSLENMLQGKPPEPILPQPESGQTVAGQEYNFPIIVHNEPEVTAARELEESIATVAEQSAQDAAEVETAAGSAAEASPLEEAATAEDATAEASTAEPENAESESTDTAADDSDSSAELPAATGNAQLYVRSPNESWIEILDSTGQKLYFNLAKKGQELNLEGIPPFKVLIGNSSGVVVKYNQVEQNISAYSNEGVSRFLINQNGPFRPVENPPQPSE